MQTSIIRFAVGTAVLLLCISGTGLPLRAQEPQAPSLPEVKDPFVEALLETKPSTPDELVRAIDLLLQRRRGAVAKVLLEQLSKKQLNDAQLAQLASRHGLDFFLRLARSPELAPQGEQFYRRVLQALKRHTQDPQRLRQAVEQLTHASPQVRQQALRTLVQGREQAAAAILQYVQKQKPKDWQIYRDVLLLLKEDARGPVLAALHLPAAHTWPLAAEVASRQRWPEALPHLLSVAYLPKRKDLGALIRTAQEAVIRLVGRMPSRIQAITLLYPQAERYFAGQVPPRWAAAAKLEYWEWEPRGLRKHTRPKEEIPAWLALEVLRPVRRLSGPNRQVDRLLLACEVELLRWRSPWNAPLPKRPGPMGDSEKLFDLLQHFQNHRRIALQVGVLELLAHCGNAKLLEPDAQGNWSPVARMLQHAHPRVRFAALQAVASWRPQQAFPGCHLVPQLLAHFSLARGERVVLLGMRNTEAASRIAGVLRPLGFDVQLCRSARELLRQAVETPDAELVLLDPYLPGMKPSQLVQRLRADFRTAGVPIATVLRYDPLAPGGQADRVPGVPEFVPTEQVEDAKRQMEKLLAQQPLLWPNLEQRLQQAQGALRLLARWLEERPSWLEVASQEEWIRQALPVPALNAAAADVLARWGSYRSQRALLDVVNQSAFPLAMRRACGEAFAASVKRFGVLLPPREILAQYDRYNQSAQEDAATQKLLSGVLDVIEQWSKQRKDQPPASTR